MRFYLLTVHNLPRQQHTLGTRVQTHEPDRCILPSNRNSPIWRQCNHMLVLNLMEVYFYKFFKKDLEDSDVNVFSFLFGITLTLSRTQCQPSIVSLPEPLDRPHWRLQQSSTGPTHRWYVVSRGPSLLAIMPIPVPALYPWHLIVSHRRESWDRVCLPEIKPVAFQQS